MSPDKYSSDAKVWRLAAEVTYSGARTLFDSENAIVWFPAAILGHHALELPLKAALIKAGRSIEKADIWGHVLVDLANKLAEIQNNFPARVIEDVAIFDAYFDQLRYPHSLDRVDGLGQEEGVLLGQLVATIRPFTE